MTLLISASQLKRWPNQFFRTTRTKNQSGLVQIAKHFWHTRTHSVMPRSLMPMSSTGSSGGRPSGKRFCTSCKLVTKHFTVRQKCVRCYSYYYQQTNQSTMLPWCHEYDRGVTSQFCDITQPRPNAYSCFTLMILIVQITRQHCTSEVKTLWHYTNMIIITITKHKNVAYC